MGDNNRKRKHQRWNPKTKQKSVEAGVTGLFFTCEGHEKMALQEAYSIIDQLLDDPSKPISEIRPQSSQTNPDSEMKAVEDEKEVDSDEDIADALKKACDNERKPQKGDGQPRKERRCIQRPTGVKNCIFISIKDADITSLSEKMVELTQKEPRCRYLQRVYPADHTLAVDLGKLNECLMKVVSDTLKLNEDGKYPTYSVEFKARNNDSVGKHAVLQMIDDAVLVLAPTARVSLNHADVTFFVQVVRTTIMVGVCRQYYDRRKYSLRAVKADAPAPTGDPPVAAAAE